MNDLCVRRTVPRPSLTKFSSCYVNRCISWTPVQRIGFEGDAINLIKHYVTSMSCCRMDRPNAAHATRKQVMLVQSTPAYFDLADLAIADHSLPLSPERVCSVLTITEIFCWQYPLTCYMNTWFCYNAVICVKLTVKLCHNL